MAPANVAMPLLVAVSRACTMPATSAMGCTKKACEFRAAFPMLRWSSDKKTADESCGLQ